MTSVNTRRVARTAAVLLVGIAAVTGCAPRPLKAANKQKAAPAPLPKGVEGQGITVNWLENLPNGTVRPVMDIKAATGTATTGTRSGVFNKAIGTLYRDGKPTIKFQAPVVRAVEETRTLTASGRVKAVSVDPPGVTVEADRVTWKTSVNRVIAEGNVTLRYQRPGEAAPIAWGGPVARMTIDTELKQFHIP